MILFSYTCSELGIKSSHSIIQGCHFLVKKLDVVSFHTCYTEYFDGVNIIIVANIDTSMHTRAHDKHIYTSCFHSSTDTAAYTCMNKP